MIDGKDIMDIVVKVCIYGIKTVKLFEQQVFYGGQHYPLRLTDRVENGRNSPASTLKSSWRQQTIRRLYESDMRV